MFGILAWPAYANKEGNPYNYLLYSNIEKAHPVYEFEFNLKNVLKLGFSSKYKILHFHWPNYIISVKSTTQAWRRLYSFFIFIWCIKLLKKKVVWTVHNLESHESKYPLLEKKLYDFLYKNVDGFISLNKNGLQQIAKRIRNNNRQKIIHIAHPHYKGYYSNEITKKEARNKFKLGYNEFVFLFLGQIRAYKNVTGLIKAFKNLNCSNARLLIAGKVNVDVENELELLIKENGQIKLYDKFIKDSDLQFFLNCADIIVTPYNHIFNSGSVFLNLSFNKPTLAPDMILFKELKQMVGTHWIKTYSGNISSKALSFAMEEVKREDNLVIQPSIDSFGPEKLAQETIEFYKIVLEYPC